MGHTLLQELLTMKLKKDMPITPGNFVSKCGEAMYNYLEHTHGREEAQVSQPQLLTCLQESVSLDNKLNQLRLDQMLRMSQGKSLMVLTQCLDALDNIAALADKATPRKGAPIEGGGRDLGGRRHVNWTEIWHDTDDDDGSNGSLSVDGFTEDEVVHYLVHRMAFKKQLGFISGERWTSLSAECRKYLREMPQDLRNELCEALASEMRGEGGTIEANSAKHLVRNLTRFQGVQLMTTLLQMDAAWFKRQSGNSGRKRRWRINPRKRVPQERMHTLAITVE